MTKEKSYTKTRFLISRILWLLLGSCLTFLTISTFPLEEFPSYYWGVGAFVIIILLIFIEKKQSLKIEPLIKEIKKIEKHEDRFVEEMQKVMKGHLKVSILFWIHYYKKEKTRSLENAKEEIFKNLRKEFHSVSWMEEILKEIEKELKIE